MNSGLSGEAGVDGRYIHSRPNDNMTRETVSGDRSCDILK